jgi:hypothetical protein
MFPVYGWPLSPQQLAFAQSLFGDLRSLGFKLSVKCDRVCILQTVPNSTRSHRAFYREAHRRLQKKTLASEVPSIVEFEKTYGSSVFIEGKDLNLAAIDPRLRPVDLRRKAKPSPRDCAIVDYLRAYQTVASRQSVGRENVYILEDHGHPNTPIMGALVLASARFYQPHRDEVLGWPSPLEVQSLSIRRQQLARKDRMAGLNRIMQLAICCALPPYSRLGAASLLAVAPFVGTVRDDFRSRWYDSKRNKDPDLVAVTTTTSMGLTGTPFQALYASLFFDETVSEARGEKWNKENTIYDRLGEQHPWLTNVPIRARDPRAHFEQLLSEETWDLALVVAGRDTGLKRRHWILQNMSPRLRGRLLKHVIETLGLSLRIFQGNPVGVFLGAVDKPALESLRTGKPRQARPILSWEKAVRRFKSECGSLDPGRCSTVDRQRAIRERALRAVETTLDDILLSHRAR